MYLWLSFSSVAASIAVWDGRAVVRQARRLTVFSWALRRLGFPLKLSPYTCICIHTIELCTIYEYPFISQLGAPYGLSPHQAFADSQQT